MGETLRFFYLCSCKEDKIIKLCLFIKRLCARGHNYRMLEPLFDKAIKNTDAKPTGQDNYGQEEKTRGRAMAEHGRPRCCLDHSLLNDSSRLIRSFMGLLLSLVALFHVDGAFVVLHHVTRHEGRPAIGLICTPLHKSLPTSLLLLYLARSSKFFSFHLMVPSRNFRLVNTLLVRTCNHPWLLRFHPSLDLSCFRRTR